MHWRLIYGIRWRKKREGTRWCCWGREDCLNHRIGGETLTHSGACFLNRFGASEWARQGVDVGIGARRRFIQEIVRSGEGHWALNWWFRATKESFSLGRHYTPRYHLALAVQRRIRVKDRVLTTVHFSEITSISTNCQGEREGATSAESILWTFVPSLYCNCTL